MKSFLQLILLFGFPFLLDAQEDRHGDSPEGILDCTTPTYMTWIDTNDLQTEFYGGGQLFGGFYESSITANNTGLTSEMMLTGLWMGGFDPGGNMKLAASTYGFYADNTDYFSGPLLEDGITDLDVCTIFDRAWIIRRADIEALKQDFEDNGVLDNPVPEDIRTWPAPYNFEFLNTYGLALNTFILAPFYDRNGDGVYNINDGDYPEIKGDIAYWKVINDNGGLHGETNSNAIQMEIQIMAYAFNSPQNDLLNSTIFYDLFFRNKAIETIDSLYIGLWADPDFGYFCNAIDHMGTIPDKNMIYAYTTIDSENMCYGTGFQNYIFGLKMLKGPLKLNPSTGQVEELDISSSIIYHNGGVNNPPAQTTDPSYDVEYYNYLNGHWRDGSPQTIGGIGYGGTETTNFVFPDLPNDPDGWSMCTTEAENHDRRILMNVGPLSMGPGAFNSLSYAVTIYPINEVPCPDLTDFINHTDQINDIFSDTKAPVINNLEFGISPNPADQEIFIQFQDKRNDRIDQVRIYDVQGRELIRQNDTNQVSVVTLNNGIYLVECILTNGKRGIQKLVIAK